MVEIKQTTPAAEISFLLLFQIDSEGSCLSCSRIKAQSSEWVRESACDTLLKTLHTHTLSYCCKSHHSALPCSAGWECQQGSEGLPLSLSLFLRGWVFSHYTPPLPHTHTPHPPPSVLHVVFIEELRAAGPNISLFRLFLRCLSLLFWVMWSPPRGYERWYPQHPTISPPKIFTTETSSTPPQHFNPPPNALTALYHRRKHGIK